jgi:Phage Mu protein F like protein.
VGISAGVAAAMREAAGTAITAKAGAPATVAELETVITAAGDDALLRMAVSVHDLVSLGRAEEAKARQDEIEDAVYSALLDGNTCDECEVMDGAQTTDLAEAADWTPNGACQGGGRCRCVTVYQLRQ